MNSKEKFSVVIRCKNEESWIGHCIQSVIDKFEDPEINVVNNGSTDQSIEIISSFRKNKNIKNNKGTNYTEINIFDLNNYTPGKSLNYADSKSKNDNILIISAHCVLINFVDKDLLET